MSDLNQNILDYGAGSTGETQTLFHIPTFITMLVFCGLASFLELSIVPRFEVIFKDFHATLPSVTIIALASSHIFRDWAWTIAVLLPILMPIVVGLIRGVRQTNPRRMKITVRITALLCMLLMAFFIVAMGMPMFDLIDAISSPSGSHSP